MFPLTLFAHSFSCFRVCQQRRSLKSAALPCEILSFSLCSLSSPLSSTLCPPLPTPPKSSLRSFFASNSPYRLTHRVFPSHTRRRKEKKRGYYASANREDADTLNGCSQKTTAIPGRCDSSSCIPEAGPRSRQPLPTPRNGVTKHVAG